MLDVSVRYEVMGMTPEEIMVALPHLDLSQIHAALSYYYAHKSDLELFLRKSRAQARRRYWSKNLAPLKIYTNESVDRG